MIMPAVRERYLRDPVALRLGGLAADLARIASWAEDSAHRSVVGSLLEESKYFAEWTAPDAPLEIQAVLADVQVQVACWHRRWIAGQPEPVMREEAQRWSDRLLALSGLVEH